MIKLIHSYQYLNFGKYKNISINDGYIVDSKKNKLVGIHGLPKNEELYNSSVSKLLVKKKSLTSKLLYKRNISNETNLCIYVNINYNKLYNYIKNGDIIPEQDLFFRLLRRNFKKNIDKNLKVSYFCRQIEKQDIYKTFDEIESCFNILNENIIKFKDLYIDIKLERIYFNIEELKQHISINYGNILISNPCGIIRNIIDNSSKKTCVICKQENIKRWSNTDHFIIDKNNLNNINCNSNIIIIPSNLLSSIKYKNLWSNYINNNQTIKDVYKTLQLNYNRNNKIKTSLLFHLLNYDKLILDDCIIDKELLECFNYKILLYLTDDINMVVSDLYEILNKVFNISMGALNFNQIKDGILMEKIEMSKININYNYTNLNCYNKRFLLDNIDINKQNLYNSLELNINPTKIIIDNVNTQDKCSICLDKIQNNNIGTLPCKHLFCHSCLLNLSNTSDKCPMCRSKFDKVVKIIKSPSALSKKLEFLYNLKNCIIFSKYEESIKNLSHFYNDVNKDHSVLNGKNAIFKNDCIYLTLFKNYNSIKNIHNKKIYILEMLNNDDIYFKCILKKLNIKNVTIINCIYN